jgi:hypothetical protein
LKVESFAALNRGSCFWRELKSPVGVANWPSMTAKEVLKTVALMPSEDWMEIQSGIAEMLTARFSDSEKSEIHEALTEADAEFDRGEGVVGDEIRRQLGLR